MKSSQSSPSLYLTKLMVQNFFFWYTIPEYILHSLPYPVVLGVGSRSTSPKGDWDSRATSAADTPPIGFYFTNLNATHAAFLYPAVGQSGATCNQMQRRYWNDTKREVWVFIFSAPKSEHNGCFRGTIGRLHLFHLLRDGGLRAYVASWFSICFWNFIFSFYYYPLIN